MRLQPGEVAGSGWRPVPLQQVVDLLRGATPHGPGPLVVALDGRGGAGKSVLGARIQGLVPNSAVVHTDDVAWWHSYFDWARLLVDGVLAPARRGEAVCFRPPAWESRGREGAIEVPAGIDLLLVEGTGVIRAELADWIDASLYLQGDLDVQEQRLVQRDGDSPEIRAFIASWLEEEIPLMARERPWERATLLVDTTSAVAHGPDELVVADPVVAS